MSIKPIQEYISFEDGKQSVNVVKLVKLWERLGLSGQEFMELIREEVERKQSKNAGE